MTTCFYMAPLDLRVPRTGEPIVVGETVWVSPPIVLCASGLHASEHALQTLEFRQEGCLTLVELSGEIIEGDNKLCATERKTLAVLTEGQTKRILRLMACVSAEMALQWGYWDHGNEPDRRSIDAIDAARQFTDGLITSGQLAAYAAAADAAYAAAYADAAYAAYAAAYTAADAAYAAYAAAADAAAADAAYAAYAAIYTAADAAAYAAIYDVTDRMALDAFRENA